MINKTCIVLAIFFGVMALAADQPSPSANQPSSSANQTTSSDDYSEDGDYDYYYYEDTILGGNKDNCSAYSVDEENGEVTKKVCGDGMLFDAVSLQCLPATQAICTGNETLRSIIVRKCCGLDQVWNSSFHCVDSPPGIEWSPTFHQLTIGSSTLKSVSDVVFRTHVADFTGKSCNQLVNITMKEDGENAIYLLQNGSLYVREDHDIYAPAAYCLDQMISNDKMNRTNTSSSTYLAARYCSSAIDPLKKMAHDDSVLIYLCEPLSKAFDVNLDVIDDQNSGWVPPLVSNSNGTRVTWTNLKQNVDFEYGPLECDAFETIYNTENPFLVEDSGNVSFLRSDHVLTPNDYCMIRIVVGHVDTNTSALPVNTTLYNTMLLTCNKSLVEPHITEQKSSASVKKCCPHNHNLWQGRFENGSRMEQFCVAVETDNLAKSISNNVSRGNFENLPMVINGFLHSSIMSNTDENIQVESDGTIFIYSDKNCDIHYYSNYCIDYWLNEKRMIAMFKPHFIEEPSPGYIKVLLALDLAALVITFVLYIVLPDPAQMSLNRHRKLRQTILGKLLLSYLSAMILTVAINYVRGVPLETPACVALGAIEHFGWMSSFGWLLIISVEIYWGTKQVKRVSGGPRFRLYSVLGWLGPALVTSLVVAIDFVPSAACYIYRPELGSNNCGVSGLVRRQLYITLPIGIMVAACSVLYILTVLHVRGTNKRTGNCGSNMFCHQQRERNVLCMKLFLIMGIPWLFDLISGFSKNKTLASICDVIVLLQPIIIFIVFIIRDKLLKYMWSQVRGFWTCQQKRASTSLSPLNRSGHAYLKNTSSGSSDRNSATDTTDITSAAS